MVVEWIAHSAVLAVAWRGTRSGRGFVLARPRRGDVDLGDRDTTPRVASERADDAGAAARAVPAWVFPASVTVAVVAAATARAAVVLI